MSIVKRQHYVWRQYLRAWSSKDQIHTLLKEMNEVKTIKLMGVAQEKYFYRLRELSDADFKLIEGLISNSHSSVKELLSDFLFPYRAYTRMSQIFRDRPNERLEGDLREIEVNTLEKLHGHFEGHGAKLIACRSKEELEEILSNPDDRNTALIYLCVQYFRTNKMKKNIIDSFMKDEDYDVSRIWNIVALIMSLNTAQRLSVDNNRKFRYFENQTSIPFVTGDQPVLNIKQDSLDKEGHVKELEFFYPLSPINAISVHLENSQVEQVERILINAPMVDYFNLFIIENSLKFSFSDNKEYLSERTVGHNS